MMSLNRSVFPVAHVGAIISSVLVMSALPTIGLTGAQINQVAEQVTVFIRGVENADNFGSGVLIHREGDRYKVLTAAHVVELPDDYTVTTADKLQHRIVERKKFPKIDLAVVTFQSSESYATAKLGDATELFPTARVFVAGFPKPGFNIPVPTYTITDGNITTLITQSMRDGYGIAYTNPTRVGMSGGPVFNEEAKVIGIHGRKEGETDGSQPDGAWLNLGIPINLYQNIIVGGGELTDMSPLNQSNPTASQPASILPKATVSPNQTDIKPLNLALLPISVRPSNGVSLSNPTIEQYCETPNSTSRSASQCQTVVKLQPFNESSQANTRQELENYFSQGGQAYQVQNYTEAIALYSQALTLSPNDPITLHNRGVAYYAAQQPEKALADFQGSMREFEADKNQKQVHYLNTVIQKLKQELHP